MRKRTLRKFWNRLYLVEWCEHRNVTQADLARLTGLSQGLISQIVSRTTAGAPHSLEKIATALRIPLGYLFDVKPRAGHRWVRYSVPIDKIETVHAIMLALDAQVDANEEQD